MRALAVVPAVVLLALAACGSADDAPPTGPPAAQQDAPAATAPAGMEMAGERQRGPTGTRVTLRGSPFGPMIWGPRRQAVYVFERDRRDRSRCYGACAEAWPPVYTRGEPRAGRGVRRGLLGTTRRRDGRLQVTYAGKPLYFYAHEGRGEVRCHEVDLNGGFWWVVGADGRRRP